jgi:hypothetical protein
MYNLPTAGKPQQLIDASLVVMMAQLLPLVSVFNQEGEAPWHL